MAIVALTNIYYGLKSYVLGEIIEGLNAKEEARLVKLRYAKYTPESETTSKKPTKKQ